jgi:hypothetical protein
MSSKVLLGMSIQAFITCGFFATKVVDVDLSQQLTAGILLAVIALGVTLVKRAKRKEG